ncbi:MAG: YggT family protein [Chloroflexi bacterium]|nr:YggT family protein [Chloroflexota bacterium]
MTELQSFIGFILSLMAWMIVARALLSWFPNARNNQAVQILIQLTDPILVPLSRLIPRAGMFDFSPMIAIFVLFTVARWLGSPI